MDTEHFEGHGYYTAEDLRKHKDELKDYYVHTPGWVVREGHAREYLAKHVAKDARILDIGASGGDFLQMLKDAGFSHLSATDLVDYCSERFGGTVPFVACDLNFEKLPFPDASFDAVTSLSVAEHLENQFHFFREAHRVLRPNGIFVVSIPNAFHIWSKLSFLRKGDLTDWNDKNAHISLMTKAVFRKTVLSLFDVEGQVYEQGFLPYFPGVKMPRTEFFGRRVCYFLRKK